MSLNNLKKDILYDYCLQHTQSDSKTTSEIEQFTWANEDIPQMICGQLIGNFLQTIIKLTKTNKIVEVGMFTGYSALKMAEALPETGVIHTCEIMNKHIKTAQKFFSKSSHASKIKIHPGPAIKTLENLQSEDFDLAFIDADKSNYLEYYKRCFALIRTGGIIILDNMLWSGEVINPLDDNAKSLRKTGDYIQNDSRVFNLLLPIRDGIMICIKN